MHNWQDRTQMLIGSQRLSQLQNKSVIVFGLGGVGGICAESLVRVGIPRVDLVDFDTIDITNINRQIIALQSTVGQTKVEVAKKRFLDMNPNLSCQTFALRYSIEEKDKINLGDYDFCIDAIDQVSSKLLLIEECQKIGLDIISAMGAGNKLHPEMLELEWLSKTSVCPLARIMRKEVKSRDLKDFRVVYSKELPIKEDRESGAKPASISFVPPAAGLIMAGEVTRTLMEK